MKKTYLLLFIIIVSIGNVQAQNDFNYELSLIPVSVNKLPGLHSYAFAQHDGKWLLIGGRRDGLHARQPFNAFPASQNNTVIFVVDVENNQVWTVTVDNLRTGLKEQLQSTNMNFYQNADSLYIIGGYGFSPTANNHITYPNLTSIEVSGLMNAIINDLPIDGFFKQIENDVFRVTGGHLKMLNSLYYLVGGHRFDGRYNPMGNPTFTQSYTNQIKVFSINNSGSQLSFDNYSTITDPVHLRRRDYNLVPQIFPDGKEGLTISSGVFQINADLPFLYPVDITEDGHTPITEFNQYLSNYHSPVACLYDEASNEMHSIFFGGMSQYYYENGTLIKDDLVPFVKTISRVTRDSNGNLTEYQMPVEMPALKGSSAEFIPNLELPHFSNKVFRINDFSEKSVMIGHIFGGISSSMLNPFSSNQTNNTSADTTIYEVWLTNTTVSTNNLKIDGTNPYKVEVFPNPFDSHFVIKFDMVRTAKVSYFITNSLGQTILQMDNETYKRGTQQIKINLSNSIQNEVLMLTVVFDNKFFVTKQLIKN